MKTKRILRTAAGAFVVMITLGMAGLVPAASAASSAAAADTGFWLWQDSGYNGGSRQFTGSKTEFAGSTWSNGEGMQNSASSMRNYTGSYVGMWDIGTSCTGTSYVAQPHSVDSSFSNNNFNDKASCLKFL
jgi:hypothetical protein